MFQKYTFDGVGECIFRLGIFQNFCFKTSRNYSRGTQLFQNVRFFHMNQFKKPEIDPKISLERVVRPQSAKKAPRRAFQQFSK